MLYREICRFLSFYLWIFLLALLPSFAMALYCDFIAPPGTYLQPPSSFAFFLTIMVTMALSSFLWLLGRASREKLYRREALLLVLLVYFLTPCIAALPFYFSGTLSNFTDAYFEATSGLTTTGATLMEPKAINLKNGSEEWIEKTFVTGEIIAEEKTVYHYKGTISPVIDHATDTILLTGLEAVAPALLFWRSFTQWLGGGGIIVLFVAILPALGIGGKVLFQTEVTGPSKESIFPQIKETASKLWKVYLSLTLLQTILLLFTSKKMTLFDAITLSFATISTGGFTTKNLGIAAYDSATTEYVIMLFMILGSISFALYFILMRGKFERLKDPELKVFLLIILFSILLAVWQLIGTPAHLLTGKGSDPFSFWEAVRYGAFQTISAQTSTGFATANYDLWPFPVQVLLLNLMFVGGMAGSTAGGLKVIRQQTFFRIMLDKIESIFRPDTVRHYRIGHTIIDNRTATTILCFFMVAAALTILGTFLFVLTGIDPETSLSTITCLINNAGMAFRMGGPTETFAFLSPFAKWVGSIWMIAGRLEFFALLIAFVPAFWRSN